MENNTNIYNINFELDLYKAIMKHPLKINNKVTLLEPISKIYNISNIQKINNNDFNKFNFDYKKVITKNIYNPKNEYEKENEK